MKNNSNEKNKFTCYFTRVALAFSVAISCVLFAQAQISPLRAQIEQQQRERERMIRQSLITDITVGLIKLVAGRGKRDSEVAGRINRFAPVLPPLFLPLSNNPFTPKPAVVITSPPVQPLSLSNISVPNQNPSPTSSNLQAIPSLNVAGNLGDGTFIVKDAAGRLYSVQITNADNARHGARTPKQRARRARH
ncbi:MAG: hypothetical protein ACR2MG_08180 [Pyrinomonadaceae bacterium]